MVQEGGGGGVCRVKMSGSSEEFGVVCRVQGGSCVVGVAVGVGGSEKFCRVQDWLVESRVTDGTLVSWGPFERGGGGIRIGVT